ncbi:CD276 antigen-like protein [Labeo rohita]|uniref:CD276 antigen-like protein n=1 Tax=Labeo rohita TaxID=84645 RepID=A0A498NQY8_LABRO|nr:CD276 antigen-like protein [Labeo rohita]
MITRGCIVLLHLVMLINEVSLQGTVMGLIGGSAVLPCSSKEPPLKVEEISVNWKHLNRLKVYGIAEGKGSVDGQMPQYQNRVESFPERYLKGDFSIKLNNLQYNDTGKYQCYITDESVILTVELLIKAERPLLEWTPLSHMCQVLFLFRRSELTAEDITVHWTHNKTLKVYDIIKGKVSLEEQDSAYANRTEINRENYLKGDFALKLNNLQHNDMGNYTCEITNELLIQNVKLEVNQGAQARTEKILLVPLLSVSILLSARRLDVHRLHVAQSDKDVADDDTISADTERPIKSAQPPSAPEEKKGNESESAGRRIVERSRVERDADRDVDGSQKQRRKPEHGSGPQRQSEKSEHYGQSKRYTNWAEKNLSSLD